MANNTKGEFVYRMLGSIIGSFCREFGHDKIREMVKYISDYEHFWAVAELERKLDPFEPPYKRDGAHDFITEKETNFPAAGESEG